MIPPDQGGGFRGRGIRQAQAIRVALELILEEEIRAVVGASRLERAAQRTDHRNGSYLRRLTIEERHRACKSHSTRDLTRTGPFMTIHGQTRYRDIATVVGANIHDH